MDIATDCNFYSCRIAYHTQKWGRLSRGTWSRGGCPGGQMCRHRYTKLLCRCQFRVLAELDVQPFGISVNEESDHVIVTCSTPLRQAVPFVSKSSCLLVYHAASGHLEHHVSLDDSYEIPRHAIAVGQHFVICHGWNQYGKVANTFHW